MRTIKFRSLLRGLLVLAAVMPLASCVDNAYEYGDNVDLTLGINTDGLKVKIGSTEKIMLNDLLDIEESGVETDENGIYYFVESGNTNFNFAVDPITITVPRTDLTASDLLTTESLKETLGVQNNLPDLPIVPVKAGIALAEHAHIHDDEDFSTSFQLSEGNEDVKSLNYIEPKDARLVIKVLIETSENIKNDVGLGRIEYLSVNIPDFLEFEELGPVNDAGNAGGNAEANVVWNDDVEGEEHYDLIIDDFNPDDPVTAITICNLPIKRVNIPKEMKDKIQTGLLEFSTHIVLEAEIDLETMKDLDIDFDWDMYAHAHIYVAINSAEATESSMEIDCVNGVFDPAIGEVKIDDIQIAEELPDFLKDDDVVVDIKNPTIRFNVDMQKSEEKPGIPVSLDFTARLTAIGGNNASVDLSGELLDYTNNILYFHDDPAGPWSPYPLEESEAGYKDYTVGGISALIKKVPDAIHVDLNDKIKVKQEDCTISLGNTYEANIDYDVYIPFEFNSDLTIVYNDSACNISEDLEDTDVLFDGVEIIGQVANTIPLDLQIQFIPLDKQGRELDMEINACDIKAGSGDVNAPEYSELKATVRTNGTPINRLDRIDIKVTATSKVNGGELYSDQWLQISDLQLKFLGKVVYDANDYDE